MTSLRKNHMVLGHLGPKLRFLRRRRRKDDNEHGFWGVSARSMGIMGIMDHAHSATMRNHFLRMQTGWATVIFHGQAPVYK